MSKVRVLYQSSIPHVKMGGQKSLLALIDNLDRTKFEPEVIVPEEGDLSGELDKRSIKYHILRIPAFKPAKLPNLLKTYFKLKAIIRNGQYKIIHSDHDKFMLFVSFISGKFKTIYHARVVHSHKYDKYLSNRMNAIISISEGVEKRFSGIQSNKSNIIYNGVDCDVFQPIANRDDKKSELEITQNKFCVLFVGQMKTGKGIFDLLKTAELLDKDNFEFLFIGDFIDEKTKVEWESQSNKESLTNIKWLGQKKNIQNWMQCSNLLVLPSHEGIEGMGRVLFESMACATPVVATDTSGVNEAVSKETGILVPEKSPVDLANAIKRISGDHSLWLNMSNFGRKRAVEVFDIKVHASNVMNLYEKLIYE